MDWIEPQVPSAPRPDGEDSTSERLLSRRHFVRRVGLAGATLAVAGPVLAACGTTSTSTSASSGGSSAKPTGNRKKIGFSQPDTSASIWGPLMLGAKLQCQARGYELLESHANSQLSAQLSEIQTWIAEGVGAIVALPLDNNAIIPLIKSAHAKGVKFLDYSDNALPGVDGWVIFDNLQGAKLVGQYAGQWVNQTLGGKAQVALLTHQIQLTGKQRIEGCAGVEQAFMATHPSAQRVKDMFICGFDGSGPVIKDVGTGGPIRATGALDAVAIGKASIEAAANAIEGKSPTKINFPYVLCDAQTTALNKKLLAELA